MLKGRFWLTVFAAVILTAGSASALWFIQDMVDQRAKKPQAGTPIDLPIGAVPTKPAVARADLPRDALAEILPENPVAADEASLARGKRHYDNLCAICHGATGAGDGPVAAKGPAPWWHLGSPMTQNRTDQYLFAQIWVGSGVVMGPYRQMLEERDAWDLVNYTRYLKTYFEEGQ